VNTNSSSRKRRLRPTVCRDGSVSAYLRFARRMIGIGGMFVQRRSIYDL